MREAKTGGMSEVKKRNCAVQVKMTFKLLPEERSARMCVSVKRGVKLRDARCAYTYKLAYTGVRRSA